MYSLLTTRVTAVQTFVSFGQFAAYRNPRNFSSPDEFLPHRWIDHSAFEKHDADVFHPFSIGSRNCIGKAWGLMVVRGLLANILLNFKLSEAEPAWKWEEQNAWFVWEKKGLFVRLESFQGQGANQPMSR